MDAPASSAKGALATSPTLQSGASSLHAAMRKSDVAVLEWPEEPDLPFRRHGRSVAAGRWSILLPSPYRFPPTEPRIAAAKCPVHAASYVRSSRHLRGRFVSGHDHLDAECVGRLLFASYSRAGAWHGALGVPRRVRGSPYGTHAVSRPRQSPSGLPPVPRTTTPGGLPLSERRLGSISMLG